MHSTPFFKIAMYPQVTTTRRDVLKTLRRIIGPDTLLVIDI